MDIGSISYGYRCKDSFCEHLRVFLCALDFPINIHIDVRGEFFDREMSIFTEQVVGIGAHLDLCDLSGAGYPSGLIDPLGKARRDLEDLASSVVKLGE